MESNKISFNNFKAFGEKMQTFSKKPITLIYGPNSVGKSSLLHFIAYLNYVKTTGNANLIHTDMFGDRLDLGGYQNIIHKHDVEKNLCFEESSVDCTDIIMDFLSKSKNNNTENLLLNKYYCKKSTCINSKYIKNIYYLNNEELISIYYNSSGTDDRNDAYIKYTKKYPEQMIVHNHSLFKLINLPVIDDIKTNNNQLYLHALEWEKIINDFPKLEVFNKNDSYEIYKNFDFMNSIMEFFKSSFADKIDKKFIQNKIQYLAPLRFYPDRNYSLEGNPVNYFANDGILSSHDMWKLLREEDSNLPLEYSVLKKTNEQLKILDMQYEILQKKLIDITSINNNHDVNNLSKEEILENIKKSSIKTEIIFKDLKRNINVTHRDLGLGISQVLPILMANNKLDGTQILIEQPELHLHPKVQSELADIFIKSMNNSNQYIPKINLEDDSTETIEQESKINKKNNTFVIETHSEHLLLRIMKRMRYAAENREGRDKSLDLTPDDVCLLYVDNDGESTYIKELRLSKKGTLLDHWPHGFFEDGYKERFS